VTAVPFVANGAVHETDAVVPVDDTRTLRAADGIPVSVFDVDVADAVELPALFWAVTRITYVVLFFRPVSVVVVVGAVTVTVCHAVVVEGRYSRR
jgi:hypothetical protein